MSSESIGPAEAAANKRPPELRNDPIWRDAAYLGGLLGRYFKSDPWVATALTLILFFASLLAAVLIVQLNVQTGAMTDALVALNAAKVQRILISLLVILSAVLVVGQTLLAATYFLRWRLRAKYTLEFVSQWLSQDRFLALQRDRRIENPEQRIQEDFFFIAESVIELAPSVVGSIATVVLSLGLIWQASHPLSLAPIGIPITVPADMLVATLVFATLWTIGAHFIGRPITQIEVSRQRLEADFRHGLGQVREYSEAIAFERGAERERQRALGLFGLIGVNWRRYTIAQVKLNAFNELVNMLIPKLVPVLLSIPHILAGQMTVGQMAAATLAFNMVLSGFGFFARLYASIAALRAGVARIRFFDTELKRPITSDITLVEGGKQLALRGLRIDLPDGERLLEVDRLDVASGDRVLVRGRSGAGKSTLLRAIAGLWPYGAGAIETPARDRILFLPQRSYMPSGALAELLSYPREPTPADRGRYVDALRRLSLDHFVDRLDEQAHWRQILSPGEQQRMAAVRALLRAPDFLFLDEATSALDVELEADVYRALTEELPGAAIVSVAHRPTVARFHTTAIDIANGRAAASILIPAQSSDP
jgi:putative ATP-binding cassette transporter